VLVVEQARMKEVSELTNRLLVAEKNARVAKEAVAVRLERQKNFMANALHEIRNPLNCIVLNIEFIFSNLFGELTKGVKEEFRSIEKSAKHQQLVLESMLTLDKLLHGTGGSAMLPKEDFKPVKLCTEIVAMNKRSAKEGVTLLVEAKEVDDFYYVGAPTQLSLALLNLVSNACKFTAKGSITLGLERIGDTKETTTIRFTGG